MKVTPGLTCAAVHIEEMSSHLPGEHSDLLVNEIKQESENANETDEDIKYDISGSIGVENFAPVQNNPSLDNTNNFFPFESLNVYLDNLNTVQLNQYKEEPKMVSHDDTDNSEEEVDVESLSDTCVQSSAQDRLHVECAITPRPAARECPSSPLRVSSCCKRARSEDIEIEVVEACERQFLLTGRAKWLLSVQLERAIKPQASEKEHPTAPSTTHDYSLRNRNRKRKRGHLQRAINPQAATKEHPTPASTTLAYSLRNRNRTRKQGHLQRAIKPQAAEKEHPTAPSTTHDYSLRNRNRKRKRDHLQRAINPQATTKEHPTPVSTTLAYSPRNRNRNTGRPASYLQSESEPEPHLDLRSLHNDQERERRTALRKLFYELKCQLRCSDKLTVPKVQILRGATSLCQRFQREEQDREQLKRQQRKLMARLKKLRQLR